MALIFIVLFVVAGSVYVAFSHADTSTTSVDMSDIIGSTPPANPYAPSSTDLAAAEATGTQLPVWNTQYWAGYIDVKQTYQRAYAKIQVPAVNCNLKGWGGFWVGLSTDPSVSSVQIEQVGIEVQCAYIGATPYYEYIWEMYPDGPHTVAASKLSPPRPNDEIQATAEYSGGNHFNLILHNNRTGQEFNQPTLSSCAPGCLKAADFIAEQPQYSGIIPKWDNGAYQWFNDVIVHVGTTGRPITYYDYIPVHLWANGHLFVYPTDLASNPSSSSFYNFRTVY